MVKRRKKVLGKYRSKPERRFHLLHPSYRYEPIRLRLAERCTYTPDFMYVNEDEEVVFVEVKGLYIRQAGKDKFKMAREVFPEFHFEMWQERKDRTWLRIL